MAEIELSVLTRQCLDRRIESVEELLKELDGLSDEEVRALLAEEQDAT